MSELKTGVRTEKIIDYLLEEKNSSSLEAILRKETEEWKGASKWKNAGKRVRKKDTEAVFREAKARVDEFIGIEPSKYNPKLDSGNFLRATYKAMMFDSGIMMMGASGLIQGGIMGTAFGTIGLVAGGAYLMMAVGAALFGDAFFAQGAYEPKDDKIVFLRSRKNLLMYTLLHEYTHAVTTPVFKGEDKGENDYWCFNEGFAVGNAVELMTASEAERINALSFSIPRLEIAVKAVKKPETYFEKLYEQLGKGFLPAKYQPELYGLGYALFRLAQERHGIGVYKEVYDGRTELLFK
ncbi:MAG: hypothetical protein WC852_04635 [Candidatus Nanoarchaeia archaeon]|jgi:hypothetical protein